SGLGRDGGRGDRRPRRVRGLRVRIDWDFFLYIYIGRRRGRRGRRLIAKRGLEGGEDPRIVLQLVGQLVPRPARAGAGRLAARAGARGGGGALELLAHPGYPCEPSYYATRAPGPLFVRRCPILVRCTEAFARRAGWGGSRRR